MISPETRSLYLSPREAAGEYGAAILNLERARAALVDRITAASWLAHYPEQGPMPQGHLIPQPDGLAGQPKRSWTQVLDDLRRDAETLPSAGAVNPRGDTAKHVDDFINRHGGFVVQEGIGGRHTWFKGGTRAIGMPSTASHRSKRLSNQPMPHE